MSGPFTQSPFSIVSTNSGTSGTSVPEVGYDQGGYGEDGYDAPAINIPASSLPLWTVVANK